MLSIQNISFSIQNKEIIQPTNITIKQGEICTILGRNGAGKSTFFKILLGFYKPSSGEVLINGIASTRRTKKEYLNQVGSLIEIAALYEHLSGADNLDIIRRYYNIGRFRIDEILSEVGLLEHKDKLVEHYSSGMKQRLGLAIALLHNPKLVLLDEPTVMLDIEGKMEFIALIKRINTSYNTTFLVSTHEIEDVKLYSTRTLIIKQGQIAFDNEKSRLEEYYITEADSKSEQRSKLSFTKNQQVFHIKERQADESNRLPPPTLEEMYLGIHHSVL